MRTNPRAILISFALLSLLSFTGCAARQKNVTNLPAGVSLQQVQRWDSAIAKLDQLSQITTTLRQGVISIYTSDETIIPQATYIAILQSIGKIDQAQLDAVAFLKAQPQHWGEDTNTRIKSDVLIIQTEIGNVLQQQILGIKNERLQAQIQELTKETSAIAIAILSLT